MTSGPRVLGVGLLGAGFAARTHVAAFRRVAGVEVRAVAARSGANARRFADEHHIASWGEVGDVLGDPAIDIVVVCSPHLAHAELVIAAAAAGKHIVCEKPLTASAVPGPPSPDRALLDLEAVRATCRAMRAAVASAGVRFLYAENWVYAPAFRRLEELVATAGGMLLDLRAEESHHGSHARATRHRATAGGGALLSLGTHPIGAVLQLKASEGVRRGAAIRPVSVSAEVASFWDGPADAWKGSTALETDWDDVETWASVAIGFDDGSRATVVSSFAMLGGIRNTLEVYSTSASFRTRFGALDALQAYAPDAATFEDVALQEKLETNAGWSRPSLDPGWLRGYVSQAQDIVDAVRGDADPVSGIDLATGVMDVVYAGYRSAAEGRRIDLSDASLHPEPAAD